MQHAPELFENVYFWNWEGKGQSDLYEYIEKAGFTVNQFSSFAKLNGCLLFTHCHDQGFLLYYPEYIKSEQHEIECKIDWHSIIKNCEGSWLVDSMPLPNRSDQKLDDETIKMPHIRLSEFVW